MDKKSKAKHKEIEISFKDSGSAVDVTGSCVHVKIPFQDKKRDTRYYNLLLDCGLTQGFGIRKNYQANSGRFKFKAKELDCVILTHLHVDHTGLIPKLVKYGFKGRIIIPTGSKEILEKMLLNSAMLVGSDAKSLTATSKNNTIFNPIYIKSDVAKAIKLIDEYPFYKDIQLNDNVRFKFLSSGHIVNSASVILEIERYGSNKRIYFSGDIGNVKFKKYYVNNLDRIKNVDVAIVENTYNDVKRKVNRGRREKDIDRLKSCVAHHCQQEHGTILIPVFALQRSQTILTILYELYKMDKSFNIPIYLDGLLLNDISKIFAKNNDKFKNVLDWDLVNKITDKTTRMKVFNEHQPKIILATSGFMKASSLWWLQKLIKNRQNCLCSVGYFGDENSIIGKLKKQKTIRLNGINFKNNINITNLQSFSSHIQYDDMLDYYSDIKCNKLVLHHGNKKHMIDFKRELQKRNEEKCNNSKITITDKNTVIKL